MDPEHKFETSSYLCYKIYHLIPISFKISLLGLSLPYSPHPHLPLKALMYPEGLLNPQQKQRKNSDFPIKLHPFQRHRPPRQAPAKSIESETDNVEMDPWICVSSESVAGKTCGDTSYMQLQGSSFSCISSSPAIHLHSFAIPHLRHASMGIPDRP